MRNPKAINQKLNKSSLCLKKSQLLLIKSIPSNNNNNTDIKLVGNYDTMTPYLNPTEKAINKHEKFIK